MKVLEKFLNDKSDVALAFFWQIIGPLFILCTFALAPNNVLIFSVGVVGLLLCAHWQLTGFFYSLIALALAALAEHLFFETKHFWLLGLEGSYAVAFFITALSAERHSHFIQSLFSQLDTRNSSILNLEDEFTKSRDSETAQQMMYQEKFAVLQSQIEEAQAEQSSLHILNEVLRKTTAREASEMEVLRSELIGVQSRLCFALSERDALHGELSHFMNVDSVVLENKKLIDEINAARLDKEQTHMINETLAHLHAKENMRAKAACEQVSVLEGEKERLDSQLVSLKRELEENRSQLEQAFAEQALSQVTAQRFEAVQTERNFLKDRLRLAELELSNRVEAPTPALDVPSVDLSSYIAKEEVLHLEEKVKALSQIEILFKQLKAQFAEKNEVLHNTRSELFHTYTALEALKIDRSSNELLVSPIPQEIISEFVELDTQISDLQKENEELQNLVSVLSLTTTSETAKRKKKSK